jgi:hypothetical protein
MEIKWHDNDPESGERRYLKADRFAGFWKFHYRVKRRDVWKRLMPTQEMWEVVLDGMERRYQRREGVEESDIVQVKRIIAELAAKNQPEEAD